MQTVIKLLLWLLALYALVLTLVWWAQERLLFAPAPLAPNHAFKLGADVHEAWVEVPGARLHALHMRLEKPKGVVFFLHGNGGNVASWFTDPDFYRRLNMDVFVLDYRGYGKSTGHIESEAQLLADGRAAWASIASRYAGQRVVLFGRSLGTGLAAQLAAEIQPSVTMLVSPYTSMVALAQTHYRWVPGALLRYPLRTDAVLPQVQGPVWLAHGALDTLIPPSHSQQLKALVPQATLLLVPGAAHNDLQDHPAYLAAVAAAIAGP
jgi:uncharacterized protein